jgi:hypothetical protein
VVKSKFIQSLADIELGEIILVEENVYLKLMVPVCLIYGLVKVIAWPSI